MTDVTAIRTVNLTKVYGNGAKALDNVNLEFKEGDFAAILGPAGSGKTTLLSLISSLDTPTSGWTEVFGRRVHTMVSPDIFRAKEIGYVFQHDLLLPVLSAFDNVLIPSHALPSSKARAKKRANELLELVGLRNKKQRYPSELTNGEKQLVAIARSLINDPRIVVADEPTGSVDHETADKIFEIISKIRKTTYTTFIVATDNPSVASKAERVIELADGRAHSVRDNK